MKNEKIISSWDKIKLDKAADERLLDSVMEYKRSYFRKDKVINMKKTRLLKFSAVCACLALVIGVGSAVYHTGGNTENLSQLGENTKNTSQSVIPMENGFIVLANAEKITGDSQVVLGELNGTGAGFGIADDGTVQVRKYIEFPVRCEGENIESVTYSLKNNNDRMQLYFVLNSEFEALTDNNGPENAADKTVYIPETTVAEEYTVPYEFQPTEEQFGTVKNSHKADPVILSIGFTDIPETIGYKDVDELKELQDEDVSDFYPEMLTKLIDMHRNEMQIEVTVHFTDGTSQTKTIQLSYESADSNKDFTLVQITGTLAQQITNPTPDTPVIG